MRAALRKVTRGAVVGGSALLLALLAAAPAAADYEDQITSYDMTIDVGSDGVAEVRLDLAVDFGTIPNHGPYLTWTVKQEFDDTQDRIYRFRDIRVNSDTAPDNLSTEEESGVLAMRIGDEDRTITGVHEYTITFRVEGWVNSASFDWPDGDLADDEFYVNLITFWEIPVNNVHVTVTGPASIQDAACYIDRFSDTGCDSASGGADTATFRHARVDAYQPFTVAVVYPAGTFGDVEPILQERWAFERAFALTPGTAAGALVVGAGGTALLVRRLRRTALDEEFLGLTPGLTPAGEGTAQVGLRRRRRPVAVQFQPPEGFRPGQIGTLVDEVADPRDVTATIVDLAVRGYLRIVRIEKKRGADDWQLDRTDKPADDLWPFESLLVDELFEGKPSVRLSALRTKFASSMARVQDRLYADVTARGWFRGNPKDARAAWAARGFGLLVLGAGITALVAARTHWGLAALPLPLLGVGMLVTTKAAPARTARGTAVLTQAEGFRTYLATAEANQLRFEEGEDLFSRYLPWAVAFDLTERWAQLFAQLAAQGRVLAEPTWYIGPYYGVPFWAAAGTLGRDLSAFTSTATTALTAPAPGSSGSSGFGGGGFGGGGVGGGGGGTW